MIRILSNENRETLAPLCSRGLTELELAGTTFGALLLAQWARLGDISAEVSSAFWPSDELLMTLAGLPGFQVISPKGRILAETTEGQHKTQVVMDGKSIELDFPWQILALHEDILSGFRKNRIDGTIRPGAAVDGVLILGEGSVILPGVYIEGTAVIGKNCKIGPNCYLRGCTSIADDCHVGQAVEIKNSILQHKTAVGHLSYVGDSIIGCGVNFGAGTIISNFRHDGKNHRTMIQGELMDTGRRKFGAVIGDCVHTGIHTAIYPGRKIWPGISLRPGTVVQKDLTESAC